jgi:hypothetical protein
MKQGMLARTNMIDGSIEYMSLVIINAICEKNFMLKLIDANSFTFYDKLIHVISDSLNFSFSFLFLGKTEMKNLKNIQ